MRRLILIACAFLLYSGLPVAAQSGLVVVQTCGTLPLAYLPGAVRTGTQDVNGLACSGATITGGGDATAANQVLQTTQLTAINTILGLQADAACSTDNGTCTIAALIKRGNQRLTTINTTLGTPMQATGGTVGIVAGSALIGNVGIDQTTPGTTNRVAVTNSDPCTYASKTNLAISQNGTSSVQLIALSGSTVIYVCSLSLIAAGATTVALTTGTGTACVTGNAAVIGTTTANIANSMSFAANGGMTLGNGGSTIAKGAASSELCMVLGTSVFVSGNLTYVQQ